MIKEEHKPLLRRIVDISYRLHLGHLGSCITALPIIEEIYSIKKPDEKFVLSSGHAHLAHLVVMEKYAQTRLLEGNLALEQRIEKYGIHCDRQAGCDFSTGSLGHGIGASVGFALADRSKNVYCLISDGECAEGSVYEALTIAEDNKLDNLKVFINKNGYAAYRETKSRDINSLPFHYLVAETNMNDYPEWLRGQIAHYKVLDKEEYKELMEILK